MSGDTWTGAYDPGLFRAVGERVLAQLTRHLEVAREGHGAVLVPHDPESLRAAWARPFPTAPDPHPAARLEHLLAEVLRHSNHLHHPGYVGHQVAVPLPAAAWLEAAGALLNNGMAIFEMGQVQTVLEDRLVRFLCETLGLGAGAGGVLTHGGSLGNLTALLAARQARAGYDVWTEGTREPLAVLVSEQAHYCVARAVQVMGWGAAGACTVAVDDAFRLDPHDLAPALGRARAAGRRVVAVVASACSTATGSFDPLPALADFCAEHDLWLHVDGAHGASLALGRRYRGFLEGVARADSVVWDLHKMLGLPALSTAVLFRDGRRSHEAFAQEASYLFDGERPEERWFDVGQRTLECTKRAMGTTAALLLEAFGSDTFADLVDAQVDRARELETLLRAQPDVELAVPSSANILCFRLRPAGVPEDRLDALQDRVRSAVLASGSHYLVRTRLRGRTWLRVTLMNPATDGQAQLALLEALRRAARSVPT